MEKEEKEKYVFNTDQSKKDKVVLHGRSVIE